jgi:hypothetical protein
MSQPVETFAALDALPFLRAAFIGRLPDVDVVVERDEALARLAPRHDSLKNQLGFAGMPFATATQVHGHLVVPVTGDEIFPVPDADGLLTTRPGVCLGIYVADCAAVFLTDREGRGIALVHSGKKGTEQKIAVRAVEALTAAIKAPPSSIVAVISPCIRPPHYEIDFAGQIAADLAAAGVAEIHDNHTCTASHPDRYYSYRREKGLTGRMLALLALTPRPA